MSHNLNFKNSYSKKIMNSKHLSWLGNEKYILFSKSFNPLHCKAIESQTSIKPSKNQL